MNKYHTNVTTQINFAGCEDTPGITKELMWIVEEKNNMRVYIVEKISIYWHFIFFHSQMKWCRFLLPVLSLSFGMFRFNYTYRVKIRVHILVKLFTLNSNVLSDFNVRFYLSSRFPVKCLFPKKQLWFSNYQIIFVNSLNLLQIIRRYIFLFIYFQIKWFIRFSKNKFTNDEKRSRFSLWTTSIYNVRGQQLE